MKNKKIKYFKSISYVLTIFPIIFIISTLVFYIYYGLFLNFWGISGINPFEHPAVHFFTYSIVYSWIITLISILFFIPFFILTLNFNIFDSLKRNIFVNSLLFSISIILVFSKLFEFALD